MSLVRQVFAIHLHLVDLLCRVYRVIVTDIQKSATRKQGDVFVNTTPLVKIVNFVLADIMEMHWQVYI